MEHDPILLAIQRVPELDVIQCDIEVQSSGKRSHPHSAMSTRVLKSQAHVQID